MNRPPPLRTLAEFEAKPSDKPASATLVHRFEVHVADALSRRDPLLVGPLAVKGPHEGTPSGFSAQAHPNELHLCNIAVPNAKVRIGLPRATPSNAGLPVVVKNASSGASPNQIEVIALHGQKIDGATSPSIIDTAWESRTFISTGSDWTII
jgi:hypothetical protein